MNTDAALGSLPEEPQPLAAIARGASVFFCVHSRAEAETLMALQVITANRLRDGHVVFLADGARWVEAVGQSHVAESDEAAAALTTIAERAVAARAVVAPYLIEVVRAGDRLAPRRYREVIRALGPSSHPEFGRPDSVTAARQE